MAEKIEQKFNLPKSSTNTSQRTAAKPPGINPKNYKEESMAKGGTGGSMNKHNAYQNTHNKAKYERQNLRTAKNKAKNIKAQERFIAKKQQEKAS
jgi:hypothetical protein